MATGVDNSSARLTVDNIIRDLNDDTDVDTEKNEDKPEEISLDEEPEDDSKDENLEDDSKDEDSEEDADNEEDEDKDEKKELKDDEDEDELELAKIPRRAEIKAKYPNIFKEFPALDHIIQREKAFAEVFPTLADAREAKDRLGTFAEFESELLSGNLEGVLKSVKSSDEKAYNKIADNYLQTLYKVDPSSHLKLTNNVLQGTLHWVEQKFKNADKESDEYQVFLASKILHKAVYGTADIKAPELNSNSNQENPAETKLKNERQQFEQTKLNDAVESVSSRVNSTLEKYVDQNIDPKGNLPPYVREKLKSDVLSLLDKQMKSDTRFRNLIDKLWMKSKSEGYSEETKKAIRKALISKAGTVLPSIIQSKKAAAMKGLNVRSRVKDESEEESQPREKRDPNRTKMTQTRRDGDKLTPRPGESARDFLMRD